MTARRSPLAPFSRSPWAAATPADLAGLFASARRLREQARAARPALPLAGRNLALMRHAGDAQPEDGLHRAALDLGAQVAQLKLSLPQATPAEEWHSLARVLGRMYDAIDCASEDPALPDRIAHASGIPVFDGLDQDGHPLGALADLLTWHDAQVHRSIPIVLQAESLDVRAALMVRAARALGHPVHLRDTAPAVAWSHDDEGMDDEAHAPWRMPLAPGDALAQTRADNHRSLMQAVLLRSLVGD